MVCKYCKAEVEDDVTVCPMCGKDLEQEAAPKNEKKESGKKKSKIWVKLLAITGVILLALVLVGAVLHFMGLGKQVLHSMKFWRENNAQYKLSYTVKNEKAEKKKDIVVATVGEQELTNGELQAHYWMAVYDFLNYNYYYLDSIGLDINKPLSEQYYDEENGVTYQQWFMEGALESWYRYATLVELSKEAGFTLSEEQQKYITDIRAQVEALAEEYKYTDIEKFIDEQFFPGCSFEIYMTYTTTNYVALSYYDTLYQSLIPNQEEIDAYYTANEATFVANGIGKDAGDYYDVRHVLVGIDGGAQTDGTYGEDQWAACLEAAQELLDSFLANEPTEEKFAEMAYNNSRDPGSKENGGLYSDLTKDYGFIKAFEDWYTDESRQVGDTGLVKNEESSVQGYHIMYFCGSTPIWEKEAESAILTDKTNKLIEDGQAKWAMEVNYKKIVLGQVDLTS